MRKKGTLGRINSALDAIWATVNRSIRSVDRRPVNRCTRKTKQSQSREGGRKKADEALSGIERRFECRVRDMVDVYRQRSKEKDLLRRKQQDQGLRFEIYQSVTKIHVMRERSPDMLYSTSSRFLCR